MFKPPRPISGNAHIASDITILIAVGFVAAIAAVTATSLDSVEPDPEPGILIRKYDPLTQKYVTSLDTSLNHLTDITIIDVNGVLVNRKTVDDRIISVYLPNVTENIGSNAFNGCTALTSVSFPAMTGYIDENAFNGCTALTSVDFPAMKGYIGLNAFGECTSLTSVSFPVMTDYIKGSAFNECTALTSVEFPAMTGYIENLAFSGCTALTSVKFPNINSITNSNAFFNCIRLGETDPGVTVIFKAGTWTTAPSNTGTSGGRSAATVSGERLVFQNGVSGTKIYTPG